LRISIYLVVVLYRHKYCSPQKVETARPLTFIFTIFFQIDQSSSDSNRRGTLADLGRSFGGRGKKMTAAASISGHPPPSEPDFMSKIRKRRETSADITVLRKGSGHVTDLKSDISK
jgi:hypothetical protein